MVFSQTSHKAQSILKVVDVDRLKPEKNQQVDGINGVIAGVHTGPTFLSPLPVPTTSFSQAYLKPEPVFESKMFHDMDSEFFQDLDQLFSGPAKDELVQTTDSTMTEESAHNTDTLHTPLSPRGWEVYDANSPAHADFYINTPIDPLSPNMEGFPNLENKFLYSADAELEMKIKNQRLDWDINNMPVVLSGDLAPEEMMDLNPGFVADPVVPYNTHNDTEYTKTIDTHDKMLFFNQQDDYIHAVTPWEVENNDGVIPGIIINQDRGKAENIEKPVQRIGPELSLDLSLAIPLPAEEMNTPEVLKCVEAMEKEDFDTNTKPWPLPEYSFLSTETSPQVAAPLEYEPITPKSESHIESDGEDTFTHTSIQPRKRKRRNSEDSDKTYTPEIEYKTRKYNRRKSNIPIKDMILALEASQQLPKARRGRPPKRRESTVSSLCSIDDNASSVSTQDSKYRELRDKNNEASKRSRMNRKFKELQMEQMAVDLEERNKKLRVQADILEDMTKKLKDALMRAMLQK